MSSRHTRFSIPPVTVHLLAVLLLALPAAAQLAPGTVLDEQKIGPFDGNFPGEIGDFDLFGSALAGLGDHDGDGTPDMIVGMWHDDAGGPLTVNSGCVYIMFMEPDGTVRDYQKISKIEGGMMDLIDGDHFGGAAVALGDHDGDGIGDICVGAWHDQDAGDMTGAVYVLFLNADGTVKAQQKINAVTGGFGGTILVGDHLGTSLAYLGDLDGDTVGDVLSGARGNHDESSPGTVWVILLNTNGTAKAERQIGNGLNGFTGTLEDGDFFGEAVEAIGDLDGDGVVDVAVGAIGDDDGGTDRGAVWLLFMNTDGSVKSAQKISSTSGGLGSVLDDGDRFGVSLAAPGDFDGDGVLDLFVGASEDDDGGENRGAMYFLALQTDGTVKSVMKISQTVGGFGTTLDDGDQLGYSAAPLGDLDGDGIGDLAAAAWFDDDVTVQVGNSGAVYVMFLHAGLWTDLGGALAGGAGTPVLSGTGSMVAGELTTYVLGDALPFASAWLVLGLSELSAAFKGGVLVPSPDVLIGGLPVDGTGAIAFGFPWPAGIPMGASLYWQYWIPDPAGVFGWAASNGLSQTSP